MEIAAPREPVYYYECSGGRFRLVYFIPPAELRRLHDEGHISDQAMEDLPDGVDLGCTEPDFAEFEELYDYRPPVAPEALQRAFFTIFSSTCDWQTFRGAGFVPAVDLEKQVEAVDQELKSRDLVPAAVEPLPHRPVLQQRRARMDHRAMQQARIEDTLRNMPAEGVDPDKTLRQQQFSKITMGAGKPAEEVFSELHQKQKR